MSLLDQNESTVILERIESEEAPTPPKHPIKYRPDIDGLRTLAVVPVVIFHAYPDSIKGGFIGVDVFFVISGYLISGILFKENTKGTFTYADFYSRRIRRIFPALLLVLTFTLVGGCVWLLDKALRSMAATMVAGTLFSANLQLLTVEQGYFDASVKENPLLHLWSLGVEEQFYIFWPLFVTVVNRLSFRNAVACQVAVVVESFACNVLFLGFHGENKYSFYFPLSRFWQMAVGGLLAYINLPTIADSSKVTKVLSDLSPLWSLAVSVCGMAAIVVGYVVIDESKAFPGYWALLPTIGTACLILAGPSTFMNKYVLGNAVAVYIGQISYALYLWHWPLLVYAKLRFPRADLRPFYMQPYSMVVLSVVLSIATLYLVENQLRRRKAKWLVPTLFGLMVVVCASAVVVFKMSTTFSLSSQGIESHVPTLEDFPDHLEDFPGIFPESPFAPVATPSLMTNGTNGTIQIPPTTTDKPLPTAAMLNWSRGPRLASATVAAIRKASDDWSPWENGYVFTDQTGARSNDDGVKVLNGKAVSAPVVVVLGDSHANMIAPRFARLLELADKSSRPFPQVMFRTFDGTPSLSCIPWHASNVDFITKTKPKVVLYTSNWIQFLRAGGGSKGSASATPACCKMGYQDSCENQSVEDRVELIQRLETEMRAFAKTGTRVFVATTNPEGDEFSAKFLLHGNSVGSTAPISRASFRNVHSAVLGLVEDAATKAGATLIDFSDNQCLDDVCQVVSMKEGEPVFKDSNHIRPYFARNYLTVLDQVVQAALAA